MIYNNILDMIGNTPSIKLNKISNINKNMLYAKLEKQNPGGSSKDRISYYIIRNLIKNKKINNDTVIIEATSGNTGIGLAMVCAYFSLKLIVIMCETVTIERVKILEAYGAVVILTNKNEGIEGAIKKARILSKQINNSYYIDQFNNFDNMRCHYDETSNEIIADFKGDLHYIFVGMGSCGTIMGIAKKLKEQKNVKIIGIEPCKCPYYSKGEKGDYSIPGIGSTFIPGFYDKTLIDEIVCVDDDQAKYWMYKTMQLEGISLGISSGAVVAGTMSYIKENEVTNKNILMLFPDSIEKYLSIL